MVDLLNLLIIHHGDNVVIEFVAAYLEPVFGAPRHRHRLALPARQSGEHMVRIVLSHFLSPSRSTDDESLATAAARAVWLP
jgi:hypothetical protein